ncbi:MAG: hypothetical protein DRN99_07895 [Thermoproteota archaeon]|nr:MAG: hypothetical protein DRN99_07895 [Candidatus Korarchaeota archaeon]
MALTSSFRQLDEARIVSDGRVDEGELKLFDDKLGGEEQIKHVERLKATSGLVCDVHAYYDLLFSKQLQAARQPIPKPAPILSTKRGSI